MRQSARIDIGKSGKVIPVKIKLDGAETFAAQLDNISATGLAITAPGIMKPGERVACEVEIPIVSSNALFSGQVRWCAPGPLEPKEYRSGLQLVDLNPTAALNWHQLLSDSIERTTARDFIDPTISLFDEKTGVLIDKKQATQFFVRTKLGTTKSWMLGPGKTLSELVGSWAAESQQFGQQLPEVAAGVLVSELWDVLCQSGGAAIIVDERKQILGVTSLNKVAPIWWQYQISSKEMQKGDVEWQRSILSHELRGPIGSIKSTVAMLNENILTPEEFVKEGLGSEIEKRCDLAMEELDAILEVAKKNAGDKLVSCLRKGGIEVINEWTARAREKSIELKLEAPEGQVDVPIGDVSLRQIYRNLISNAIKYSHNGSAVIVRLSRDKQGRPILSVIDQGVGINEAALGSLCQKGKVLERKPTAGEAQTGFGLYWVRLLTEEAGASLKYGNNAERGSYFQITFQL